MFVVGKEYRRADIRAECGGNARSFLPRKNGVVVAACLRLDLNPGAPRVILCGSSVAEREAGEALTRQQQPIPIFLKTSTDGWVYQGMFKVVGSSTEETDCAPFAIGCAWTPAQIKRVIRMEEER